MKNIFSVKQIMGLVMCGTGGILIIVFTPVWLWLVILGGLILWFGYILYKLY